MNAFLLAWRNLWHQRWRALLSVGGVGIAVVLIFMQLSFLGSVKRGATQVYDHLDFDLLLVSSEYLEMNRAANFPRARLVQARAVPEVASVLPVTMAPGRWRDPRPRE